MKKKASKKHHPPKKASTIYLAILRRPPDLRAMVKKWFVFHLARPEFKLVTILNDDINDNRSCNLSRGLLKRVPDWVCWVNKDGKQHVIQFTNGRWPFDPSLNTDHEKITVPALQPSAWYQISRNSGGAGQSVPFEYGVDVPPPAPGPEIVSDD